MQCKRALGLKVSSALVLHTGNVAMFLSGLPLLVGDQPLPLCTPTLLRRTPTRHHELLSTAFPGKDLGCSGLPRKSSKLLDQLASQFVVMVIKLVEDVLV